MTKVKVMEIACLLVEVCMLTFSIPLLVGALCAWLPSTNFEVAFPVGNASYGIRFQDFLGMI